MPADQPLISLSDQNFDLQSFVILCDHMETALFEIICNLHAFLEQFCDVLQSYAWKPELSNSGFCNNYFILSGCILSGCQVFGGLLIGIGTWTLVKFGDYITLSESVPYATGSKVMIAAGVLIAVISFLGCCGAWKENKCMLIIVSL